MVDRRVPGVVEVTPAQIQAARALTRWERASGGRVEGAVEAIARLKPDEPGEPIDLAAARVAALTDTVSSAMRSMAQIAELRTRLAADNPELDKRLALLEEEAIRSIAKIVERREPASQPSPVTP